MVSKIWPAADIEPGEFPATSTGRGPDPQGQLPVL